MRTTLLGYLVSRTLFTKDTIIAYRPGNVMSADWKYETICQYNSIRDTSGDSFTF